MSPWKRLSQLERQVEASSLLPQPKKHDCDVYDIRQVLIERIGLGLQKLTPTLLNKIKNNGYDNYIRTYAKAIVGAFSSLLNKLLRGADFI